MDGWINSVGLKPKIVPSLQQNSIMTNVKNVLLNHFFDLTHCDLTGSMLSLATADFNIKALINQLPTYAT